VSTSRSRLEKNGHRLGLVLKRLVNIPVCNHVKEASAARLAPRQLGFGVSGDAEAVVRTARLYLENSESGKLFIKVDFRNAFNTVRRNSILEAVAKHFQELLPFTSSTVSRPSVLQFASSSLISEEGAKQGDLLGPLIRELLESMMSELVLAYLDDIALGDEAEVCLNDFLRLEEGARRVGLEINHKFEVVGHTVESTALFEAHNILLPESIFFQCHLAGCATVFGPACRLSSGREDTRVTSADEKTGTYTGTR
jgi:hypothetical protein